jgi:hypothetical protein
MLTRKAKLLLSLTAATPLLFAACTDNGIFNPLADASGTYQLTVYQGRTLPTTFTIQPGDPAFPSLPNGGTIEVIDGTMVLHSDATFVETNNYIVTPTGQASEDAFFVSQGSWTLSGIDLTLAAPLRDVTGTLDVDTINYQELDEVGVLRSYEYKR